ncbi:MAG TPA: VOC family protein [Gaiellales bacterium]|nr:VOC family protein [Gaiellales bacterium]
MRLPELGGRVRSVLRKDTPNPNRRFLVMVVLRLDDVRQTHRDMTANGVVLETEPFDLHGGAFAAIRDPWKNLFVLTDRTGSR